MAERRLVRESKILEKGNNPHNLRIVDDDVYHWTATFTPCVESVYHGELTIWTL